MRNAEEGGETRSVNWNDPRAVAEAGRGLSGLGHLRRIAAGELPPPPFGALLDLKFAELAEGRIVFIAAPDAQHYNLIGTVHGGYIATLLDSALCASLRRKSKKMSTSQEQLNFSIRRASRDDVPEIVRLLADDPLGSQRENYRHPLPQSYYDAFDEIDQDPHNQLVVAELDGEVIGTLQLTLIPYLTYQGGKRAQIEAVRVDQRYRSHGIGGKLFKWAIMRAREEQCHLVQLTTDNTRPDAHRFYERLGFVASHAGMKLNLRQQT